MFWRKKKDKGSEDPFQISFDLDRRHFFRVAPDENHPVRFKAGAKTYDVKDISAGGLALEAPDLAIGKRVSGELYLPGGQAPLPVSIDVIKPLRGDELIAVRMGKINEEDREVIHQYVLRRQLEILNHSRAEREAAAKLAAAKKKLD